jgi:hypothetical protein
MRLDHHVGRETVRDHDRLRAAGGGRGEQLKGAAAVGLEAVVTTAGLGHGVSGGDAGFGWCTR